MNCKIYYMVHGVPLALVYNTHDDIFLISKTDSSELIIFCF